MNYICHEIKGYIQTIYLIEYQDKLLLLDGCCRPDVPVVVEFIQNKLNRSTKDLKLVVSTHAHPDHFGGLSYFKTLGVKVAGPKELNNWYAGVSGFLTYLTDIMLTYLVAMNKKSGLKNIFFPRKVMLDYILEEGRALPVFEDWIALECPGHTTMDLTLYHSQSACAYVADNFVGSKRNVFRPYPIQKPLEYKASLKRYIKLEIKEFWLAHHGRVEVSKQRIEELIKTTPGIPRKHLNTLPAIFLKLFKSLLKK